MPNRSFRVLSAPGVFLAVRVEAGSRPGVARPKGLALTRLEPGYAEGMGGRSKAEGRPSCSPATWRTRGVQRGSAPLGKAALCGRAGIEIVVSEANTL